MTDHENGKKLPYLEIAENLTDKPIYQRGLRIYLDGKVMKPTRLSLCGWRKYEVIGGSDVYTIKVPLTHIILQEQDLEQSIKVFKEFVTCTCLYFENFGTCKHIVAICGALDQEFRTVRPSKPQESEKEKKEIKFNLEDFAKIEKNKKYQDWISSFDYYLSVADIANPEDQTGRPLQPIFREVFGEKYHDHEKFLNQLKNIIAEALEDYKKEKRLVNLITNQKYLLIGEKIWWDFWKEFVPKMEEVNQETIWFKFWMTYTDYPTSFWGFESEFKESLKTLSEEMKHKIAKKLRTDGIDEKTLIDFCLISEHAACLLEKLDILDPTYLIEASKIIPDKQEQIQYKLLNQAKLWSNFLETGQYDELVNFLKKWEIVIGRTEVYEEAIQYIKDNHSKKKKLMKLILD